MSKAQRIREQNARQRIAAQQAAARKAEARRRFFLAGGSVLVVIAVVIGFVIAKSVSSSPAQASAATAAQTIAVTSKVTSVPAGTLNSVGAGAGVAKLQTTQGNPALLTSGGKPEVLYVGAEWCPYCAAERWAMAVALSRFGTFSGIGLIHSSADDSAAPSTPTLSFYKSTYTSSYVNFQPVEWYGTNENGPVQQAPSKAQLALFTKYDAPPYSGSTSDTAGSYPFLDIGNKYLDIGAQYDPKLLAGLSWSQVATDINNPSSPVAKAVDGSANAITAAICKVTPNAPASVCSSKAVQAAAGYL